MKKEVEHFSDDDIDAISPGEEFNYFLPVIDGVSKYTGKVDFALDIGCGNGVFSNTLKRFIPCKLYGIDGSEYALSKARQYDFDRLEKIEDFSNDVLPFRDSEFDFIMCKDVLEHLINPKNLANEIQRTLKSSGFLLVHVPNHFPLYGRLQLLFFNNIDPFRYFPKSKRWNFPHIRFYTKESVLDLFSEFELLEEFHEHFFHFPIASKFLSNNFKRKLSHKYTDLFSEGITLLLKKK